VRREPHPNPWPLLVLLVVVLALVNLVLWIADAHARASSGVTRAICATFGPYCGQALRVSWCESRWNVWARNGQYLGLFQMGARERARYGHGTGAWAQSRAALRYFVASGRTWRPWSCKP